MSRILLAIFLAASLSASAQKVKIITDSAGNHGFLLSDKKYLGFPSDFNRIGDSIRSADPGWRMPTAREMKTIFEKTFSKRLIRSTYVWDDCYTADTAVGVMRGWEFQLNAPSEVGNHQRAYTFFFIKPF